jgi:hypothetical protein
MSHTAAVSTLKERAAFLRQDAATLMDSAASASTRAARCTEEAQRHLADAAALDAAVLELERTQATTGSANTVRASFTLS